MRCNSNLLPKITCLLFENQCTWSHTQVWPLSLSRSAPVPLLPVPWILVTAIPQLGGVLVMKDEHGRSSTWHFQVPHLSANALHLGLSKPCWAFYFFMWWVKCARMNLRTTPRNAYLTLLNGHWSVAQRETPTHQDWLRPKPRCQANIRALRPPNLASQGKTGDKQSGISRVFCHPHANVCNFIILDNRNPVQRPSALLNVFKAEALEIWALTSSSELNLKITLPETKIALEDKPSQKETSSSNHYFSGAMFFSFEVPINSGKCSQAPKKSRDARIRPKIIRGTYRLCQSCWCFSSR